MGCTSSAPIMADSQNDATDGPNSKTKVNYAEEPKVQNSDANHKTHLNLDSHIPIEMLPNADKINENLQLPSYNSIFSNNGKDWSAKDTDISTSNDNQENIVHTEGKLKTFFEVVDKVLENNVSEEINLEEIQEKDAETNEPEPQSDSKIHEIIPEVNETPETINENIIEKLEVEDNNLEHESPTQSESRSTRWEALADIAAELPPSLAVDPVTGQIYSLTK